MSKACKDKSLPVPDCLKPPKGVIGLKASTVFTEIVPACNLSDTLWAWLISSVHIEAAKAYFATQNRCVTQEDYEARTLAMPAKFGGIAKVFCGREVSDDVSGDSFDLTALDNAIDSLETALSQNNNTLLNN